MTIDCLGIVLAGGLSSRMGKDKASLPHQFAASSIKHNTMLDFSTQLFIKADVKNIVISGSNCGGEQDLVNQGGPLAGIYSMINKYKPRAILAMPVDMPFMTSSILKELKLKGELSRRGAYFNDSPLPVYLPVNDLLEPYLQQTFNSPKFIGTGRGPSFKHIFKLCNAISIPNNDKHALTNINTPEQWQQAQRIANNFRSKYV